MVPNLIKHVKTELTTKMNQFLDNSYIINVVLGEMETDVKDSFVSKYVSTYSDDGERTKEGQEIKILTNYPEDITDYSNPFILIGLGDGKESKGSIGSTSGSYDFKSSPQYMHDKSSVSRIDNTTLGVELSEAPALSTLSIPNFTITESNTLTLKDNILEIGNISPTLLDSINYSEDYLDVTYEVLQDSKNKGTSFGYWVTENVSVLIVSKNLDEIRALDSIIKAIFIIMRQEDEEMNYYQLGNLTFNSPYPLDDSRPNLANMTFGREILAQYEVDYSMDSRNRQDIEKILIDFPKK